MKSVKQVKSGWGNFPRHVCEFHRPDNYAAIQSLLTSPVPFNHTLISRGLGRSYGDSALNADGGVIEHDALNRMLAFDEQSGILKCEAGVSFESIIGVFLQRGWFLPTTPGTRYVTVGGAIASDVHGKNHHRCGAFGNFVRSIELMTASGEVLICSRDHNADIFWATIAGMGLTGIILSAEIQLVRVPSAYCAVHYRQTQDLDQTLDEFSTTDEEYEYSVAWIDCLAKGRRLGRSVLMLGNGATPDQLPANLRSDPFVQKPARKKTVPSFFPGWALNRASIRAFNELYYRMPRAACDIVSFDSYFYPLDSLDHWNRMYGRRGFLQYQAWFPKSTSRMGLTQLLERITRSGRASFLAVLKSCGDADAAPLTFPDRGHTLALDFANTGPDLLELCHELDKLVLAHDGRLYLAKDAAMDADTFAAMYPRLPEFQRVQQQVDPNGRFSSSQARRLRIVLPTVASESVDGAREKKALLK